MNGNFHKFESPHQINLFRLYALQLLRSPLFQQPKIFPFSKCIAKVVLETRKVEIVIKSSVQWNEWNEQCSFESLTLSLSGHYHTIFVFASS